MPPRRDPLDRFYTAPEVAGQYAEWAMARWPERNTRFIEPSAGDGAFTNPLRQAKRDVRAMDLTPAGPGIRTGDFLNPLAAGWLTADIPAGARIVAIGNPPFGRGGNMAVRFVNAAANMADHIAMILPRSWRKASIQARLDPRLQLAHDETVPDHAFRQDGTPYHVPCCWQVWNRTEGIRTAGNAPDVRHLVEYTRPANADFAVRRVGYHAGRVVTEHLTDLAPTTHYFLRELESGVRDTLAEIDWTRTTSQTTGPRSLSKAELAQALHGRIQNKGDKANKGNKKSKPS